MTCDVCNKREASGWVWIDGVEHIICPECFIAYLDKRDADRLVKP